MEVRTEEAIYLVKISKSLSHFIATFEENMEKELEVTPAEKDKDTEMLNADLETESGLDQELEDLP